MIRTLARELKGYIKDSILTPTFMVLEVAMEMIIPLMMASIIDKGVSKGDMHHILVMGGWMVLAAAVGLFGGVMGGKYGARASAGLARNLRKAMYEKIQTFSFANIDKFSTSSLVTRMTTDVSNIQNAYMMILRMFVRSLISLVTAMIMSFFISRKIASMFLIVILVLAVFLSIIIVLATRYFTAVFPKYDALNESVQENVTGIRVVKAFVREDYEKKKFGTAADMLYRMFVKAEKTVISNMPVMMFMMYGTILLISWVGAHQVVGGTLETGELMSLFTYCMNVLMSLMMLSMVFVMITMSIASARRISEVLNEKPSMSDPENPVHEVKDGSIIFDHVYFTYNSSAAETERRRQENAKASLAPDEQFLKECVLSDVNLEINPGETIGIIGGTGSSKSTLASMVSRLYDVSRGSVLVGGIDVRDYSMESLRNQVSVVLQNNVLFSGTILDNLRWGDENATLEDCKRACRLACADEFIDRFPDGYNTKISQGGTNVSGGQKQRLCIARALLKKPKILILDDSTSACDTATDAKIRKAFREEIPDTTKLIIAQRISSVQDADRIIVLNDGRVDGFGTHDELMKTNEIYRDIYESQQGAGGDFDQQGGV